TNSASPAFGARPGINYRAWDESNVATAPPGSTVNASTGGGTSPYSSATATSKITVTDLPQPPTVVFVDDDWASVPNNTDADGPSGGALGNGVAKGYDEFDNIQAAINAVAAGGTVLVYSGNYVQNVVVNKSVHLLGQAAATTVI